MSLASSQTISTNHEPFRELMARAIVSRTDAFLFGSGGTSDWRLVWHSGGIDPSEGAALHRLVPTPDEVQDGSAFVVGLPLPSGRCALFCGFHGDLGGHDSVGRATMRGMGVVLLACDVPMVLAAMPRPRLLGELFLRLAAEKMARQGAQPREVGLEDPQEGGPSAKERLLEGIAAPAPALSRTVGSALAAASEGKAVDVVLERPRDSGAAHEGLSRTYRCARGILTHLASAGQPRAFVAAVGLSTEWRVRVRAPGAPASASPVRFLVPEAEWRANDQEAAA